MLPSLINKPLLSSLTILPPTLTLAQIHAATLRSLSHPGTWHEQKANDDLSISTTNQPGSDLLGAW
jgi:hypothetical protein